VCFRVPTLRSFPRRSIRRNRCPVCGQIPSPLPRGVLMSVSPRIGPLGKENVEPLIGRENVRVTLDDALARSRRVARIPFTFLRHPPPKNCFAHKKKSDFRGNSRRRMLAGKQARLLEAAKRFACAGSNPDLFKTCPCVRFSNNLRESPPGNFSCFVVAGADQDSPE